MHGVRGASGGVPARGPVFPKFVPVAIVWEENLWRFSDPDPEAGRARTRRPDRGSKPRASPPEGPRPRPGPRGGRHLHSRLHLQDQVQLAVGTQTWGRQPAGSRSVGRRVGSGERAAGAGGPRAARAGGGGMDYGAAKVRHCSARTGAWAAAPSPAPPLPPPAPRGRWGRWGRARGLTRGRAGPGRAGERGAQPTGRGGGGGAAEDRRRRRGAPRRGRARRRGARAPVFAAGQPPSRGNRGGWHGANAPPQPGLAPLDAVVGGGQQHGALVGHVHLLEDGGRCGRCRRAVQHGDLPVPQNACELAPSWPPRAGSSPPLPHGGDRVLEDPPEGRDHIVRRQ